MISFTLNGIAKNYNGNPETLLLDYLRSDENIISPKDGCSPQGACGCCTVIVDQKAVVSCTMPMRRVANKEITTIESWSQYEQSVFSHAFVAKGAAQCGFCIPGIISRAKILLQKNPNPSRKEIIKKLTPHLCRCTGYAKIIEAISFAASILREGSLPATVENTGKIGTSLPKYNTLPVVLGQRPYVNDLKFPQMQYGCLKFSKFPRAKILSINVSKANALSGVTRVFVAKDIPGDRRIGLVKADWPVFIDQGETTNYVGDVLALVVAQSEKIAREAVELIEVEYEELTPITDIHKALEDKSPQVHKSGNLLDICTFKRGEKIEEIIANSEFTVDAIYQTQRIEHGYMEPEVAIAKPWEDGLEVYSQGQGVYEDQRQIAAILGMDKSKINVLLVPNGGGFGGKEDLCVQGYAALAAHLLKIPVKVILNREESIRMSVKRHPIWMHYILACSKEGKLTALKARIVGDTGAYASVGMKVLERAAGHSTGAYYVPSVDIEAKTVYTNNLPCGAMRGFGANQANFAMECAIDEICQKGGFDRWQFRYDNALDEGLCTATGQILTAGVGVKQTLEALKEEFYQSKYAGIACGIKNTGIGNGAIDSSQVKIIIAKKDQIVIYHGWTEMGQGVNTMAVQFFCQETGLPPDLVKVKVETKHQDAYAGMTTASRATSLIGNAIIDACKRLKQDLQSSALENLLGKEYHGQWQCTFTTAPKTTTGKIITHYSYSYATQLVSLDENGKIETIYAAHDAGKIINPTLFEGQIEGSLHMGLGYALCEDCPSNNAIPVSLKLKDCGILRAKEMPRLVVKGVEIADPMGPYGAKGVGEIGLVPTAPAVANAFFQFDGIRRRKLPMHKTKR